VKRAVRLCSVALAEDFSRSIRSPPTAVPAPVTGFMRTLAARLT
jgi:hypothetical protein